MCKSSVRRTIFIRVLSTSAARGRVDFMGLLLPCALGRSGIRTVKREGDGATPRGSFEVRRLLYRSDRIRRPETRLPATAINIADGWCDAPGDRNYNRPIKHPYPSSAERLWREDHLYDLIIVLSHNERPRVSGRGSAVFMHVARAGFAPTEGCVALRLGDLIRLVRRVRPGDRVAIGAGAGTKKKGPGR